MKERPILFTGDMVKAILEGRKTQTRRVIKPQPVTSNVGIDSRGAYWYWPNDAQYAPSYLKFPYGQVGDRLWVRETWVKWDGGIAYLADCLNKHGKEDSDSKRCRLDFGVKWRPSIFMPRWASRITLEIVGVRVQRIQDISEGDAFAEGVEVDIWDQTLVAKDYSQKDEWFQSWSDEDGYSNFVKETEMARSSFRTLWNSINAKRGHSWESNPWVWVVEFKRLEARP